MSGAGRQLDTLILSQRGVRVLDRGRTPDRNRLSPFWAAVGALVVLAAVALWFLLFR